jgi:hypothetical protein
MAGSKLAASQPPSRRLLRVPKFVRQPAAASRFSVPFLFYFLYKESLYPDTNGKPLIKAYFRPSLVYPFGWAGENIFGDTMRRDFKLVLSFLRPDETAVFCCPSGLHYTETLLSCAPGMGGWCLGTSIEAEKCAICDDEPTPLPIRNADNIPMSLIQTTILLRSTTNADNTPPLACQR